MHPKQFALISGIFLLLFGALAFLPNLSISPDQAALPSLSLESSYGLFFNFFPMNVVNKLALIGFGIAGLISASRPTTNLPASINFSRWVFVVMGVAAILGIIPSTNTLFGYWPLFGGEVVLHAVLAALGGYFGFMLPARAEKDLERRFPETRKRAS